MKGILIALTITGCYAKANNDYTRTVAYKGEKIVVTLHKKNPKAWKQKMLSGDIKGLNGLERNNHPKDNSLNRQHALLAILTRKKNPVTRRQLFFIGLRTGLYTINTAKKAAQSMQQHAQNLSALIAQHNNTRKK